MSHADFLIAIATVVCLLFSGAVMVYHKVADSAEIARVETGIEGGKLDSIESRLDEAISRQAEMIKRLEVATSEVEERESRARGTGGSKRVSEELHNAD